MRLKDKGLSDLSGKYVAKSRNKDSWMINVKFIENCYFEKEVLQLIFWYFQEFKKNWTRKFRKTGKKRSCSMLKFECFFLYGEHFGYFWESNQRSKIHFWIFWDKVTYKINAIIISGQENCFFFLLCFYPINTKL